MRYRPQFQHKTGRMLAFTIAAEDAKSGSGDRGPAVKKLPFLRFRLTGEGGGSTGGMLRACD